MKFDTLGLNADILGNLETLGYHSMTPIQEEALPKVLSGGDLIAQAKTGSGKTAAFGLGILSKLDTKKFNPQALVMCPTRELAEQVCVELRKLARFTENIKILSICGGTNESHQEKSLSHGVHIIVGTPGRVFKLLKEKIINLEDLNTFVLDEADRMLDMGFYNSIREINRYVPKERQTLLFSATFPASIKTLSADLQTEPEFIKIDVAHEENSIVQHFYQVEGHKDKKNYVLSLLGKYQPESTIIFCKTKMIVDDVAKILQKAGISALPLHGDHDQRDRTLVLTKFSNSSSSVLVATDVAARGLDIKDLQLVINYDLPTDPEIYVHRIGRTGREGKNGQAVNLYIDQEEYKLEAIEEYLSQNNTLCNVDDLSNAPEFTKDAAMTTIYISGGRKDKIRPGDIVGAILGTSSVNADAVGNINILNVLSYVAVKTEFVDEIVSSLQSGKIKKRNFRVGIA
jgi:ATP-independent RNA helicase DbpA